MDVRHILGVVGVLFLLAFIGTTVMAEPSPVNDPEFTINCPGNWTDMPSGTDARVCTNLSNTELANTSVSSTLGQYGTTPFEVNARRGELIILNNTLNESVVVDWEDEDSGPNSTIAANGQLEFVARGVEYATIYTDDRTYYLQIKAADNGFIASLFNLVM